MDIAPPAFGKKFKKGMFSNKETKGNFWYEIKDLNRKSKEHFFQLKTNCNSQKFKSFEPKMCFFCPDFLQVFLRTSVLKASEALHIDPIENIEKLLQILYLSKFWVGKKICDEPTASTLLTYLSCAVLGTQ